MGAPHLTAKQRAQAEVDKAKRAYDRALATSDRLAAEAEDALRTKNALDELLIHARAHPALREDPTLPLGDH